MPKNTVGVLTSYVYTGLLLRRDVLYSCIQKDQAVGTRVETQFVDQN